jgi:hypothetical protein
MLKNRPSSIAIPLLFAVLLQIGCGGPTRSEVKADFQKENPTYTILSAIPGEGDSDTVYYHIRYKKPGSELEYEVVLQYMNKGGKKWELTYKGEEKQASP